MDPIVIVGSGLAGYAVARELRRLDSSVPIVIVTRDSGHFYSKPTLSNAFAERRAVDALALSSAEQMARQLNIEVRAQVEVTHIDTEHRQIKEGTFTALKYESLVLALGARQGRPRLAGDGAEDVLSINDLADYGRLRSMLRGKSRVAILGAGLIGCEFANDFHAGGLETVLIDPMPWPLYRLLPEKCGHFMARSLAAIGVHLHLGVTPGAIMKGERGYVIALSDGQFVCADLVISATGLTPRVELAQAAGLPVGRGIRTDEHLQVDGTNVYAIGDCAEVCGLVLPYVMPITHAAKALARTLRGERTRVNYPAMPVIVKTPAAPTVVCVAPDAGHGEWHVENGTDGMKAIFRRNDGAPGGFALMGAATAERNHLLRGMSAWLN